MKTSIDQFLADIYALDASLRERDQEVRALVAELIALRPQIALDPTFVRSLRARLVEVPEKLPQRAPEHVLSWWMVRLAPIGAIALLLLMFVPQSQSPSRMDLGGGGGGSTSYRAPSMQERGTAPAMMSPQGIMKEDAVRSFATPAEDAVTTSDMYAHTARALVVATQAPGTEIYVESATLREGGYIAIFTDEGGSPHALIGVSYVLAPGAQYGITVPLVRAMESGDAFHAMLIRDNGDGRFDTSYDAPVVDPSTGAPMSVRFTASADASTQNFDEPVIMIDPAMPDGGEGWGDAEPDYGVTSSPVSEPIRD